MPRSHPVVLFALGTAAGAIGWLLVTAVPPAKPRRSAPASSIPATADASRSGTIAPETSANPASAEPSVVAVSASAPALRLWEALALRGAPVGDETKWFPLPDMTGKEGYGSGSPDEPLNPAFVAFFALTPEESDRVQSLLQSTLRLQNQMDLAHVKRIESRFRIKTAIAIPDYSAESAAVRQGFDGGLREILGDARHRVYQDWGAKTFRDDFPGLAGVRREYHLIQSRDPEAPPGQLEVVTVKIAPGQDYKGGSYTTGYATVAAAEKAVQLPLSRYLSASAAATPSASTATTKPAAQP